MRADESGAAGSASHWPTVELLSEPTRRRVYALVRARLLPSTREEVASELGISRRLAAFHLDLLAEAGALEVDYARPSGRRGPGAGRPAKRYRAAFREVGVTVPERRYGLAARLLATGIRDAEAAGPGADPRERANQAAAAEGRRVGEQAPGGHGADSWPATVAALAKLGYEPASDDGQSLRLRNCPFDSVVDVDPSLVCGMNLSFVNGLLEGLAAPSEVTAELTPDPSACCVVLRSTKGNA